MTPDAPRPDLDDADPGDVVISHEALRRYYEGEYRRLRAALAERDAEIARLRGVRALAEWLVAMDEPGDADARWERRTVTLQEIIDRARRALVAAPAPAGSGQEAPKNPQVSGTSVAFAQVNAGQRAAALAPAEDDDHGHGPWLYTEYGVLCSCRYPVDADERCTRPRDPAGQRDELLGALFETADNLLEHLTRAGSVASDDSHVYDLRHARDALAEWHAAPAPAREQADPADEEILPRIGPPGPERLDDGHGGLWEKCNRGPACGLQIVRPGKVQCWCDNEADR